MTDNLFAAPGTWSMRICADIGCGTAWLDPAPVSEDLGAAYVEYYTHLDEASGARRAARALARSLADVPLRPFGVIADRRRSDVMFLQDDPPGSVLDVGCGKGEFLARMKRRGWRVQGVDFDPRAAEAARTEYGITVHVGDLASLAAVGPTFDVITASHVIEHLVDPGQFLRHCVSLLAPGGKVVLKTPNIESLGHRRYGRDWRGLEPPRHLQLFSHRGLRRLAADCGLAAELWTSTAGAEYILTASHYLRLRGEFRGGRRSLRDMLSGRFRGIGLAMAACREHRRDPWSGEELCAVLRPADIAGRAT